MTMNQKGFTALEGMVATMLGSMVLLGLHSFSQTQIQSLQSQATQIGVQGTARSVLEVIARDIRRGGLDPTCSKAFDGISVAKSDEVRIKADLDGSGAIDSPEEDITYRYQSNNNTVERVAGTTANSLMDGIVLTGSHLRYFDGAGVELIPGTGALGAGDRAQIRRIRIELSLADHVANRTEPMRARVSTDVDMRNRFFLADTTCP